MTGRLKAVFTAAFLLCAIQVAAAADTCPPKPYLFKDYQAVRAHACAGKLDEVERYFAGRQRDYEAGKMDDRELRAAYDAFEAPVPPAVFTAWLKQYPQSYSAHFA